MASPLNAMDLLQAYQARDQAMAAQAQRMEQAAQINPLQIQALQQNMLAKQQAMQQEQQQRNAMMRYAATGDVNALAAADPKAAAGMRMQMLGMAQRNALAQQQIESRNALMKQRMDLAAAAQNKPIWDAERGVFVMPPTAGRPGTSGTQPGAVYTPAGLPQKPNKELQKLQAKAAMELPDAIAKSEQASSLIDQMIGTEGRQLAKGEAPIAPHPGFTGYVGATWKPGMRLIEGSPEASYEAMENQLKGGAFLQAFESLKGGGAITEVEGTKATQAITRMNKAQSEAEYVKAAREFQDVIRSGIARAKTRAGAQAGASTSPAAPPPPKVGDIVDGYRFKGGMAGDQNNWEKVR